MGIILASGSPRRKQLLEMLGLTFTVIPAKGEEIIPHDAGPAEAVQILSAQKAASVAAERPAEAKQADTKEYEEGERRRKRKNGVSGSFGFTEKKNGVAVEKDAIGA